MATDLASLDRDISPPPFRSKSAGSRPTIIPSRNNSLDKNPGTAKSSDPSLADVESGEVEIRNHLDYFSQRLAAVTKPTDGPRISITDFRQLYRQNQHGKGCHFVIHQHDHPISGVHYDLRLQFSRTSSVSFAVPYGLPGNPNSIRPNRMAIETRVHNLWNNLIESASHATGSLLIWDTGEYEVLPRKTPLQPTTDDDSSELEVESSTVELSQPDRLIQSFQARHIRLRLHGTRLPPNYTVSLRLPSANNTNAPPQRPKHKRRRVDPVSLARQTHASSSDEDESTLRAHVSMEPDYEADPAAIASDDERDDDQDAAIRANNAYPGASNTIGSIHQRHWFLTLDRPNSGFRKLHSGPDAGRWVDGGNGTCQPFVVRGRDYERSVVTGRSADEIMADEGVKNFIGRKMWRAIAE